MVKFSNFPMPPSVNELYANNWKTGRGRFKTKEYIAFDNVSRLWALKNHKAIEYAKESLKGAPFLSINCVFYFPESRIMTKKGMPKRLDADNRVKALLDKISALLELDDCSFFRHTYHKLVGVDSLCDIDISIMNKEEIYAAQTRSSKSVVESNIKTDKKKQEDKKSKKPSVKSKAKPQKGRSPYYGA